MKGKKILLILLTAVFLSGAAAPCGLYRFDSYAAATQLRTPEPYQSGTFTVAWEHISHASSYEVRLSLHNQTDEKTVTRTLSVSSNKADLTLFAADCTVSVSVRAVPAASSQKYRSSGWGSCEEKILPAEENEVSGYAGVSGKQYYLADADGHRMSGWKRVNRNWYYFDPKNSCLTPTGWAVIDGADYCFNANGQMQTGWVTSNGYRYFLNPADGKMVTGWFNVTPAQRKYFTQSASEGQPRGSLKEEGGSSGTAAGPGSGEAAVPAAQWRYNPDRSWSYYKNGVMAKSRWENIDGLWYYFDGNGIMLTGWQFINSRWYYLEPDRNGSGTRKYGAMWADAVTPDGYTVNSDGCWVRNGVPVTEKESGASGQNGGSGRTGRQITSCQLRISAVDMGAGKIRNASVTAGSGCSIRTVSFSKAYADWSPGENITVTVELEAGAGSCFGSSTKFSCSGGKVLSQSGGDTVRTVRLSYTPVLKLSAPSIVYVTAEGELKWLPVNRAGRYRVRVSLPDNGISSTRIVTGTSLDLWEFGNINSDTVKAEISALGPEKNSSVQESEKTVIANAAEYRDMYPLQGRLSKTEGRLRYTDDNGSGISGWQKLFGSWYHFRKNGFADGPGWYQDGTGYWYFFDTEYRMLTGKISDGGKVYFLNDGSVSGTPVGAWIE